MFIPKSGFSITNSVKYIEIQLKNKIPVKTSP